MNYDNPASRMLTILEQGKNIQPHTICRQGWQEILHTQGDMSLTLSRLGKVMELPDKIVQTFLDLYPQHPNIWEHWQSKLSTAFESQSLNEGWASFFRHIDQTSFTMLKATETLIETKLKIQSLAEEKTVEISSSLHALIEEVSNSSINEDLKFFVIRKIREIIVCIDEYKLTGVMPILDAVDSAVGHGITNKEFADFISTEPTGTKFRDILVDVANLVTSASGIVTIASEAIKLLSNG